jgi:hypothetical protein
VESVSRRATYGEWGEIKSSEVKLRQTTFSKAVNTPLKGSNCTSKKSSHDKIIQLCKQQIEKLCANCEINVKNSNISHAIPDTLQLIIVIKFTLNIV